VELKRIHLITSIVLVIAVGSVVTFVMADFQSRLEEKERELEQKELELEAEQLAKEEKERELEQKCRELERLLLTVKVDKMIYQTGDIIRVNGTGPGDCEKTPIAIQVFNPRNMTYTIRQTIPSSDGMYSFEFVLGGKLGIDGVYIVKANYKGRTVQTTFEFNTSILQISKGNFRVEYSGKVFNVEASLSNGSIRDFEVDKQFASLIIFVNTKENNGIFEVTLQRDLIDAKSDSADDTFIIFIDGNNTTVSEKTSTATHRTLVVGIPGGTEEIEIIGTKVGG